MQNKLANQTLLTKIGVALRSENDAEADLVAVRSLLAGVAIFILFALGLATVQYATPALLGTDGYYHMKIGYLMRTEGLLPVFDHLPFTILNAEAYYDHHYLYHLYLALFAWGDPLLDGGIALTRGAKLASVLLPAAAFTAVWWLFKRQKILYPFLWAIMLLMISEAFLYRMSMPRAQSLSLLLLVIGIQLLLTERYLWLGVLGFLFVWSYNAFPLLLVLAGVYLIATFMTEGRFVWQAVVYPAVGIGLGLVINPYFPQNIGFIIDHLAPKLGESSTRVGNEWSPYRTWTLVENSGPTLFLFLLGILALAWARERIDKRTLFMLGMTVLFGYMLFESRRFIEYFPPFVLLFVAFAAQPHLREFREHWLSGSNGGRWREPVMVGLVLLILAGPTARTLQKGADQAAGAKAADLYADASLWLHETAGPDIQIFQTDWDDFTRLFFYNSEAAYTAGLDPTFMELYDETLFERWVDITRGEYDQPGQLIRDLYAADYVFSDLRHGAFERSAADDPLLTEVYRDEYAVIYRVGQ